MRLKSKLLALARVIGAEAEQNALFRKKIEEVLDPKQPVKSGSAKKTVKRPTNRRTKAVLDPVAVIKSGENLQLELNKLDIEQLKDVVAQYGMDTSKLVMKWKDEQKIIDHIIELSFKRSRKGDAFRS